MLANPDYESLISGAGNPASPSALPYPSPLTHLAHSPLHPPLTPLSTHIAHLPPHPPLGAANTLQHCSALNPPPLSYAVLAKIH